MPLFMIFLIIPLIEITLFVTIGDEIGLLMTLLLCVVTAIIGSMLVQKQGLDTLTNAQKKAESGDIPLAEMFEGIFIVIAGVTLITPGFFTDAIGFLLLTPQFRRFIREKVKESKHFQTGSGGFGFQYRSGGARDPNIIDGEFEEINDNDRTGDKTSDQQSAIADHKSGQNEKDQDKKDVE